MNVRCGAAGENVRHWYMVDEKSVGVMSPAQFPGFSSAKCSALRGITKLAAQVPH